MLVATELDTLTRMYTAFSSFAELTDGTAKDYFPTLTAEGSGPLADAYDAAMADRGDSRRAWRGTALSELELTRLRVLELTRRFAHDADLTELTILRDALTMWADEYPKANHEEELVIAKAAAVAVRRFYGEAA